MLSNVLIVDDDVGFASSAAALIRAEGFLPQHVQSVAQGREILDRQSLDMLLLDLKLPDGSGLELLPHLDRARHGRVAIVTGNPSIESATKAVSSVVDDYLIKPFDPNQLITMLRQSRRVPLKGELPPALEPIPGVITRSAAMTDPARLARRIAATDAAVLIEGETGTGKEVFARAIHEMSGLDGAFVPLNCGAVAPELAASELFGHERGSFTGATQRHAGVFEQAKGGTLFLDEITEMPHPLQVHLLRALERGVVTRVGGTGEVDVPVRIVAATNRDPREAVAAGRLREDLYYRLADFTISLPPLRARDDDVVLLARHFLAKLNVRYDLEKRLSRACVRALKTHAWPGNVRELRSAVQRAFLLAPGDEVEVSGSAGRLPAPLETEDSVTFVVGTPWSEIERLTLLKVLAYCGNDKTAAARMLGISVRTVHNHVARMGKDAS